MRKPLTAVLLSALVYPGSGHFYLKKYYQAVILGVIATVSLYFLLLTTIEVAREISDKILLGEIPVDLVKIKEVMSAHLARIDSRVVNVATYSFFTCWLIGVVDSYRSSHREGKKDH